MKLRGSIVGLVVGLCVCAESAVASQAKLDDPRVVSATTRLQQVVAKSQEIKRPFEEIATLEEIDDPLAVLDAPAWHEVFDHLYELIESSPEILPPVTVENVTRKPQRLDRDELFRRFIRVVSRYDAKLAIEYASRYRKDKKPEDLGNDLWSAALDLMSSDMARSVSIAMIASRRATFPDDGLLFLERLRPIDLGTADSIASTIVGNLSSLSISSRVNLLTYVFPSQRIPLIVNSRIFDKEIPDRTAMLDIRPTPLLASYYVRNLVAAPVGTASADLFVLLLLKTRLTGSYQELQSVARQREQELRADVSENIANGIATEVARWVQRNDMLASSIAGADEAFANTGNEKFKNRAILLKAISDSRLGDYRSALSMIASLPRDARDAATDAILIEAAKAPLTPDRAAELPTVARSETHSSFVLGFALLTYARLESRRADANQILPGVILEVEELARQVGDLDQRLTLEIGAANLWTKLVPSKAHHLLGVLLRDIDSDPSADGIPHVQFALPIAGTYVEYNVPAGQSTVYRLIRELARKDLESTLATIATTSRDDIRLRATAAACAEFLRVVREKERGNGSDIRKRTGR